MDRRKDGWMDKETLSLYQKIISLFFPQARKQNSPSSPLNLYHLVVLIINEKIETYQYDLTKVLKNCCNFFNIARFAVKQFI